MVEVFEDLLSDPYSEQGAVEIASLGCKALWQVSGVALPSQLSSPDLALQSFKPSIQAAAILHACMNTLPFVMPATSRLGFCFLFLQAMRSFRTTCAAERTGRAAP
jgi:hypothetical protein